MSTKERIVLDGLKRVERKEITLVKASELMGLSLRQARRMWKRFVAEGDVGLLHRLRCRASNRRLNEEIGQRIVKRHQERYSDFGPTLACEKLAGEGLVVSPNTLTRLLKDRGLWERRRRRGRHRRRRERRSSFGSMIQMDGSHHGWFERRGPRCVLMVMIDDATNITGACFYPAETTEAAFDMTNRWIKKHGVPRSVYVDRHSIYRDDDHPEKPTQFGRAMKQLGIKLIQAHSPQAKGRVERRNALFQDRLVKEMRLRNINTIESGNALLDHIFLKDLNQRYAVKPADDQDHHRAVDQQIGDQKDLAEVLCVIESRVVGNDWCVRWNNRWLQIDKKHVNLQLPRKKVTVRQRADGKLVVDHQGRVLTTTELKSKPQPEKKARAIINNRSWKPSATHPWKKGLEERAATKAALPAPHGGREEQKKRQAG